LLSFLGRRLLLAIPTLAGVLVVVFVLNAGLEPPSEVKAASEENGDVTLTWRPVGGATEYEVHRDDERLGTTQEPTYVDREASAGSGRAPGRRSAGS